MRLLAECHAAGYTGGYAQLMANVALVRPLPEPGPLIRFERTLACKCSSRIPVKAASYSGSIPQSVLVQFGQRIRPFQRPR